VCSCCRNTQAQRVRAPRRLQKKLNIMLHLQAVSDIIRTTLGPRSMLKMLLDPNGGAQL
jgi:chaperonin GroEL (HSP60 family)